MQLTLLFWKWVNNFRAGRGLATALTVIAFLLIVAIPVTILAILTFSQVKVLSSNIELKESFLKDFLARILAEMERLSVLRSVEFDRQAFLETVTTAVRQVLIGLINLILKIGASFPRLLINGFLFLGFLVTLLPAADSLTRRERVLVPLENPIVSLCHQDQTHDPVDVPGHFCTLLCTGYRHGFILRPGWDTLCCLLDSALYRLLRSTSRRYQSYCHTHECHFSVER